MPVNAPAEYFKAEAKFHSARSKEEKIAALEEMIRLLPKHHGSEQQLAQLKGKLAKIRKTTKKGPSSKAGLKKEGYAQICLLGATNSGKSTLLKELTDAKPEVSHHPYTTTRPQVGMMDYKGIKVQLVELPATFEPASMSIARSADLILCLADPSEIKILETLLSENFIRTKRIFANPFSENAGEIKEKVWHALGLIIAYAKKTKTPMALPLGAAVRDFTAHIHKDFLRNFRYARIWRTVGGKERIIQAGLNYRLEDGDIIELHTK